MVKNLPANAGDMGLTLGLGRSPGVGYGLTTPLFLPEKFHKRWATAHGVTNSQT